MTSRSEPQLSKNLPVPTCLSQPCPDRQRDRRPVRLSRVAGQTLTHERTGYLSRSATCQIGQVGSKPGTAISPDDRRQLGSP